MENSRACASRSDDRHACAINVGNTERMISTVAGGFVLLYGLSRLPLSTIVAAVAGGALLYRGLTGRCSVYQALDMSTAGGLENDEQRGARQLHPRHGVTDAALAVTGESPPISAS
jgi:uncharacterized membrane protein